MGIYQSISNLLDNHLSNSFGTELDIFTENKKVSAKASSTWLRTTLLPNESDISTLGPTGYNRYSGLFQIDIWQPSDIGKNFTYADSIINIFTRSTVLSDANISLRIVKSWAERSIKEHSNYNTPVMVRWECFK